MMKNIFTFLEDKLSKKFFVIKLFILFTNSDSEFNLNVVFSNSPTFLRLLLSKTKSYSKFPLGITLSLSW